MDVDETTQETTNNSSNNTQATKTNDNDISRTNDNSSHKNIDDCYYFDMTCNIGACKNKNINFDDSFKFQDHLKTHKEFLKNKEWFWCPLGRCTKQKKFHFQNFVAHLCSLHGWGGYVCDYCGHMRGTTDALRKHLEKDHQVVNNRKKDKNNNNNDNNKGKKLNKKAKVICKMDKAIADRIMANKKKLKEIKNIKNKNKNKNKNMKEENKENNNDNDNNKDNDNDMEEDWNEIKKYKNKDFKTFIKGADVTIPENSENGRTQALFAAVATVVLRFLHFFFFFFV